MTSARTQITTLNVDFSTYKPGTSLDRFVDEHQLYISTYNTEAEPISRIFLRENVDIVDGTLRLRVNGYSGSDEVEGAEIGTYADDILYGTFTTVAKLTDVPGICAGFFTYTDDNNEIDIEALSSYYTKGYRNIVDPGLQLTNQPTKLGGKSTNEAVPYDFDPTKGFHNYTIVWTAESSEFYVDGEHQATFTTNVPKKPASFLWNAWSSGDPNWSAGPPREDSYTLIKSIHLAYSAA
ncbi:hypothetical protein Rhopal_004984-T1 [Rhodotorula paludigena]|uniref:GH16 domain-containing protein n=1 Tax=Rhodotorula paludigena TaxID=86838 RepID=A0AAV5GH86_9BASI|nr:hypothetical protein Rhopal_004984-T1 [Rhodotorula paludigena]